MTPLALRIVKDGLLPVKNRMIVDNAGLAERMDNIHCFEISEVFLMIVDLAQDMISRGVLPDECGFLPFPKVWIEYRNPGAGRSGILLEDYVKKENSIWTGYCRVTLAGADEEGWFSENIPGRLKLQPKGFEDDYPTVRYAEICDNKKWPYFIYAALSVINTPRIIGRRVNDPHRGLVRALRARRLSQGMFPLNSWTEILLRVHDPRDASAEAERMGAHTGERALHWVRAHLRIRLGKLEFVSAHERGNKNLGRKQSRYKLSNRARPRRRSFPQSPPPTNP